MKQLANSLVHDDFLVPDEIEFRTPNLRQDRHVVDAGTCLIRFKDQSREVLNFSYFGIALLAENGSGDSFPLESHEAKLIYRDVEVQTLHIREVRKSHKTNGWIEVGYEIIGEPLAVELILGLEAGSGLALEHQGTDKNVTNVPADFRRLVYEIKDWLQSLREKVDQVEVQLDNEDQRGRTDFEQGFAMIISGYLRKVLPERHLLLGKITRDLSREQSLACAEFFRRQLKSLIYDAPFSRRAFHKPRGYAGDYEMMNHLYRENFAGPNLFAKCLHNYFVHEPAGQAVRNRAHFLKTKLVETFRSAPEGRSVRILSVASGPAFEIQLFLKENHAHVRREAEFFYLDQDEESLKFAQRAARMQVKGERHPFQFRFINKAIKNIMTEGLVERDFDLVYSAGLFDYLSDAVAQIAAQRLFESVRPGGRLIIGNFNLHNPTLPLMDLAWDWHLVYRSPEDMIRLFSHLGVDVKIEQEELGINIFCVIQK